jgi:bifunctional DNA-binding transcriptional regulator/antitoxin component of YhaV-PrlF toxin-antitoxin module
MQTKVSARGQIAISARLRKAYHLRANSRIEWIDEGDSPYFKSPTR